MCRLGGKGWLTAWFNIVGQLAALAGIDYGCAFQTLLAVVCRRRAATC